jgi:hypothetical protein
MTDKLAFRRTVPAMVAVILASSLASRAQADGWSTAIGTGLFGLNVKGDMGFGTNLFGPLALDVDLSSSDLSDLTRSAFGVAGVSTNGTWTIYYNGGSLELEDSSSGTTAGGTPVSAGIKFKVTKAELAAAYNFARIGRSAWGVLFGADYTRHHYDPFFSVGAATATRAIGNDWTDAIVGLTNSFVLSPRWVWGNRVDAGFGGSDGSYHARTELLWDAGLSERWIFSLYADYRKTDFENSSPAQADWYRYDVAEFGPGFGVAYVFGGAVRTAAVPPPQGATPPAESSADLDRALALLRSVPTMRGTIEGHTDSQGRAQNRRVVLHRSDAAP